MRTGERAEPDCRVMALGRTQEKMQTVQVSMQVKTQVRMLLRSQGDALTQRRVQTQMQREHTAEEALQVAKQVSVHQHAVKTQVSSQTKMWAGSQVRM